MRKLLLLLLRQNNKLLVGKALHRKRNTLVLKRFLNLHRKRIGAVNDILAAFSSANIETNGFVSKSKGDVSYTIVSAESVPESVKTAVESSDEVIRVRLIK